MPKVRGWFEAVLEGKPTGAAHRVGARLSYADLSLFKLVEGLRYACPNAMDALGRDIPGVLEMDGRIGQRRNIAAYLASPRRQKVNEDGILRHSRELDALAGRHFAGARRLSAARGGLRRGLGRASRA